MAGLRVLGRKLRSKTQALLRSTRKGMKSQVPLSVEVTTVENPVQCVQKNSADDQAHDGPAGGNADNPASISQITREEHEDLDIGSINHESEDDGWRRQVSGASASHSSSKVPKVQSFLFDTTAYEETGQPTLRQWKLGRYERYLKVAMTGIDEEDPTKAEPRELRPEEMGVKRSSFLYCPGSSSTNAAPEKSGVNKEELTRPCCSSERSSFEKLGIS